MTTTTGIPRMSRAFGAGKGSKPRGVAGEERCCEGEGARQGWMQVGFSEWGDTARAGWLGHSGHSRALWPRKWFRPFQRLTVSSLLKRLFNVIRGHQSPRTRPSHLYFYLPNKHIPTTSHITGSGRTARDTRAEREHSPALEKLAVSGEQRAPQLVWRLEGGGPHPTELFIKGSVMPVMSLPRIPMLKS